MTACPKSGPQLLGIQESGFTVKEGFKNGDEDY
jgi:hypothetical protein